jgi:WD40 repeat protein
VFVATHTGRLWWIGLESEERTALIELAAGSGFVAAALSPDGSQAAAASTAGAIYLGNPESRVMAVFASGPRSRISELRFSDDGRRLVCAGQDGSLCVWDLQSGEIQQIWKGHDQTAMAAAFLTDERIISAGLDDTIRIWDGSTGHEMWRGEFGLSGVHALALSGDGTIAAWGGRQRRIVVWDLENSRKKYEIPVPASMIFDMQFSPDSNSLAVAGTEGMLRLYAAQTGIETQALELRQAL